MFSPAQPLHAHRSRVAAAALRRLGARRR